MTRARAKAIEDKVNSLLSELPLPTHETWLLPHSETLCVIRYMEVSQGSTTCKSQDGEDPKHVEEEEEMLLKLQESNVRPSPDVRRLPGHGRPTPSGRPTAEHPNQIYGRPRPPDVRRMHARTESTDDRRLLDVRTVMKLRTTDPLRTSDAPTTEPILRTPEPSRTSGPSRASGRPTPSRRPTPK